MSEVEREQPIEEHIRELMQQIGAILLLAIQETNANYGFALLMFEYGAEGRMNYISSASRRDMVAALKEFIAKNEGTYQEESTQLKQ